MTPSGPSSQLATVKLGEAGLAPARELPTGFQGRTATIYGPIPR